MKNYPVEATRAVGRVYIKLYVMTSSNKTGLGLFLGWGKSQWVLYNTVKNIYFSIEMTKIEYSRHTAMISIYILIKVSTLIDPTNKRK